MQVDVDKISRGGNSSENDIKTFYYKKVCERVNLYKSMISTYELNGNCVEMHYIIFTSMHSCEYRPIYTHLPEMVV